MYNLSFQFTILFILFDIWPNTKTFLFLSVQKICPWQHITKYLNCIWLPGLCVSSRHFYSYLGGNNERSLPNRTDHHQPFRAQVWWHIHQPLGQHELWRKTFLMCKFSCRPRYNCALWWSKWRLQQQPRWNFSFSNINKNDGWDTDLVSVVFWFLSLHFHFLFFTVSVLFLFPLILFLHVLLPIAVCPRPVAIGQTPCMVHVVQPFPGIRNGKIQMPGV